MTGYLKSHKKLEAKNRASLSALVKTLEVEDENGSSAASSVAKRTAIAANVARLKTELEFADAEARKISALKENEDELRRFKLTKELTLARP